MVKADAKNVAITRARRTGYNLQRIAVVSSGTA